MSEVGNQLKSQTLGDVVAQSFTTVGGRVYPDLGSTQDFLDLIKIVDSWRATHVPAYGQPLPNTGAGKTFLGTMDTILSASDNEVLQITALSMENQSGGNIEYKLAYGDGATFEAIIKSETLAAGAISTLPNGINTVISKGYDLVLTVTSGSAGDLIGNVSYVKTCQ